MIKIYRNINSVQTEIVQISDKNAVVKTAIMGLDEIQVSIVVDSVLDIEEGDYIIHNDIKYTLNRDAEYEIRGDVNYSYDLIFEHPQYTLINKLIVNGLTGSINFTLTGKLVDFITLLIWSVNKSIDNPNGIDTGWSAGSIIDTDYKTITITDLNCRESLKLFAKEFDVEYYFSGSGKTINFVERIENDTNLVFEQGREKGLYKITQRNVDKQDTITRVYIRGGNKNVPPEYADEEGYLKLPEDYLENFEEHNKIVERKMIFEEEFPHFLGTAITVSGANNSVITCPTINFDISAIAVGENARINFLTGDLMGNSFEFEWDYTLKQITLIEKEDETALADENGVKPSIPSSNKRAIVGDKFNFTGLNMPTQYVDDSIIRLRAKGNKWLDFFSKKRVKFSIEIDYRWMRDKDPLNVGDLVVISIPQRSFYQVIRITDLEHNLYSGVISATVSNYLQDSWERYDEYLNKLKQKDILALQSNITVKNGVMYRDRGLWNSDDATIKPYQKTSQLIDDVWHLGCKWRCNTHATITEPGFGSEHWTFLEGRSDTRLEFDSSNGFNFFAGGGNTVITPKVLIGYTDFSSGISSANWQWSRESGNSSSDNAWNLSKTPGRIINITNTDLGSNWSKTNPIRFVCTVTLAPGITVAGGINIVYAGDLPKNLEIRGNSILKNPGATGGVSSTALTVIKNNVTGTIGWEYLNSSGVWSSTPWYDNITINYAAHYSIFVNDVAVLRAYSMIDPDIYTTISITVVRDGVGVYSVSLGKSEHSYSYDKQGNLKGSLASGVILLEVFKGTAKFNCTATTTTNPTVNNTYKVIGISTSGMTYSSSIESNDYKFTPLTITSDEVVVAFTIVARADGVNTTFTKKITYRKIYDGTDGEDGTDGDGIVSATVEYSKSASPTTPPSGWSNTPPPPTPGWYLWTRTTTVYKSSPTTVAYSISYWPLDGEDGEDGFSVSLGKSEHTYSYNKQGNLKGLISSGNLLIEVIKGTTKYTCDNLTTSNPTIDNTYRVTNITATGLTYNTNLISGDYQFAPSAISLDEAIVTFTILARTNGSNTTFTRKITYSRIYDGEDGIKGDGVVIIYRHSLIKPVTPLAGVANPSGWNSNPDRGVTIGTPTNWVLNGKWYQSEELVATGNSTTSRIAFTTSMANQTLFIELWADGHSTYDYVYAGKLDTAVSTLNYQDRARNEKKLLVYEVPTAGSHYIDIFWRKGISTIAKSNRGYFSIVEDMKTWKSSNTVINNIFGTWSEPTQYTIDSATEERVYSLSKTTALPPISDSDPYINEYIPLPCDLSAYRGDFTTSRAYSIGQVVVYSNSFYKAVKAVTTSYSGNPTNTEYFEPIKGWTDNQTGATREFPYEHVALRKKVNGLWGNWQISISSNYSIGNNYIPMGWFDYSIEYRITQAGIPLIKRIDPSTGGTYLVYSLKADVSTVGEFIEEEWTLIESEDFLYMQQAYIEKLQGELILAREVITASEGFRAVLNSNGLKFFNEAGVMNIRIGLKNGYAVLEYYDNNGTFLYDLGPNGLKEMEMREEKWTTFKGIFLGTSLSTILNSSNRDKYKKSWNQSEVTYYVYTSAIIAGVNQDSTNDGKIFTTANKSGSKIPNGYYCKKMPLNGNVKYKEATNTNALINSQLPYINASNENVYDREKICFTEIEYYFSGDRGVTLTNAYWNESPESGGVVEI